MNFHLRFLIVDQNSESCSVTFFFDALLRDFPAAFFAGFFPADLATFDLLAFFLVEATACFAAGAFLAFLAGAFAAGFFADTFFVGAFLAAFFFVDGVAFTFEVLFPAAFFFVDLAGFFPLDLAAFFLGDFLLPSLDFPVPNAAAQPSAYLSFEPTRRIDMFALVLQ